MKLSFIVLWVCGITAMMQTSLLRGESIYIAQTSQGGNNGTNPANAHDADWFNTAGNWGADAGKIKPGDTVHLCGIIHTALVVQASGTAGHPITILFEPDAKMSSPAFPTQWWGGGAITLDQKDFITVDGGVNGIIENTDNGTALGHQIESVGVSGANANYLTVKNLTIRNIYVRTSASDSNGFGAGVRNFCSRNEASPALTGFLVTHCTISDAYIGIAADFGIGCSNYEFSYNTIYNCNFGGMCADRRATSTMSGLWVHHNHLYNWANWDDPPDRFHHNGFYAWAESGGSMTEVTFEANYVGPGYGQHNTAGLFVSGKVSNILAKNNIFDASDGTSPANAQFTCAWNGSGWCRIYNNTFFGEATDVYVNHGLGESSSLVYCYNNAFYKKTHKGRCISVLNGALTLVSDYNNFYGITAAMVPGPFDFSKTGGGVFYHYEDWKGLGYDLHSGVNDPLFNTSYVPQANSALIGAGMNLSSTFTTDYAGNARPATGPWTIGAFEFTPNQTQNAKVEKLK